MPSKSEVTQAWQVAQACWSPYLRLAPPELIQAPAGQPRYLAQVRLKQQQIQLDLDYLETRQLSPHLTMLLAHEIGHIAYCPGSLELYARMLTYTHAAIQSEQRQQPALEAQQSAVQAQLILNVYLDLLVNQRLFLNHHPIQALLQAIAPAQPGKFMQWQGQIYGLLWNLPALFAGSAPAETQNAAYSLALLAADLIEVCATSFETGADAFARLALGFLDDQAPSLPDLNLDAQSIQVGWGFASQAPVAEALKQALSQAGIDCPRPQYLEPENLIHLAPPSARPEQINALRIQYYRERVWPWISPSRRPLRLAQTAESPQTLADWQLDRPIQELDWTESLSRSPKIIPGLTTFRRKPEQEAHQPGDLQAFSHLDLYLDTSGSLANPNQVYSELVAAAFLITLSALRQRIPVRITRWSGENQLQTSPFSLDESLLLPALLDYSGGATSPPLAFLSQNYLTRQPTEASCRLLFLSDEGALTWFQQYPQHLSKWEAIAKAARGGAWLVLDWLADQALPTPSASHWRMLALDPTTPEQVLTVLNQ